MARSLGFLVSARKHREIRHIAKESKFFEMPVCLRPDADWGQGSLEIVDFV